VQDVNAELNELYELRGRVKALAALIGTKTYLDSLEALPMLGFEVPPEKETENDIT